ncbi:hypothetical protein GCM10009662_29470 [Catellatospora coxensis]
MANLLRTLLPAGLRSGENALIPAMPAGIATMPDLPGSAVATATRRTARRARHDGGSARPAEQAISPARYDAAECSEVVSIGLLIKCSFVRGNLIP